MNIALDYDNTFTRDEIFWEEFIIRCSNAGHRIWIVTLRNEVKDKIELDPYIEGSLVGIVYCDGMPKFGVCRDRNIFIDIWVDDAPESVHYGSLLNARQLQEWRDTQLVTVT